MAIIPRSATNTARTIYSGLEVAATSKSGTAFTHPTRELGPVGKRIHSFLNRGPENSLGRRAITTARSVMDFRGRGIGRLKDLPQGSETTSKAFKNGTQKASARIANPHGYVMGHLQGQLGGRTRVNLDPANSKSVDYRIQGYYPRGMGGSNGSGNTAGIGGQFFANSDAAQFIRNRNRRVAGYVAGGASLGVANASIDRRGYSRRKPKPQPSARIGTPKGLGRNA